MHRLRTTHKLIIPAEMCYHQESPYKHLMFFNICSLPKYLQDLAKDQVFRRSHVACNLETHTTPQTNMTILQETHPHQVHHKPRKAWPCGRAKHGISIFSKTPLSNTRFIATSTMEAVATDIVDSQTATTLVAVYRYHRKPVAQFFEDMNEILACGTQEIMYIGGDINLDYSTKAVAHRINKDLQMQHNLRQLVKEETTRRGTIIDHIYTTDIRQTATVFHPYYSDHHIITCTLNKN